MKSIPKTSTGAFVLSSPPPSPTKKRRRRTHGILRSFPGDGTTGISSPPAIIRNSPPDASEAVDSDIDRHDLLFQSFLSVANNRMTRDEKDKYYDTLLARVPNTRREKEHTKTSMVRRGGRGPAEPSSACRVFSQRLSCGEKFLLTRQYDVDVSFLSLLVLFDTS